MRLRNRFMLIAFGILVFVVATPILVLYARGFQIDWVHHKIVKTGTFVIKTMPSKAMILLNGKPQSSLTPSTIRFVLPGDYDVTVQKDGYQSWTKRLTVLPQFVTWINEDRDFITLFYTTAQEKNQVATNFASLSQDNSELAYVQNSHLFIYNLNNQTSMDLGDISNYRVPFTFTPTLSWTNGANVLNLFNQRSTSLPIDVSQITKIESNGDYMDILAGNQLYSITPQGPVLVDTSVENTFLDGENLWYVTGTDLKSYNLRLGGSDIIASNLPTSTNAKIIRGEGNTFLILDKSLYILGENLQKIYDGVTSAQYDTASHSLLFADSNEILTYDPSMQKSELLLRSISPIVNPVMNFYTGYVFFENENKIKAIELDGRDHRNVYTIADVVDPTARFALSADGSVLTVFSNSQITSYQIR